MTLRILPYWRGADEDERLVMKKALAVLALGAGAVLLSGCATMSEDQCMAGDWGGKGYQDGLNGRQEERLQDHASACGKYGVTPNPQAYYSAREQGLRTYCRWENGFRVGRQGNSYYGVCSPAEERRFLPAYQDGVALHSAESALSNAESSLRSAEARIRDRQDKLDAKERELRQDGLSREERERIRERIREVRGELRDAHRNAERASYDLRQVEYETRPVIRSIMSQYSGW